MTNRKSALLDSGWQDVQRKTFTKWSVPYTSTIVDGTQDELTTGEGRKTNDKRPQNGFM